MSFKIVLKFLLVLELLTISAWSKPYNAQLQRIYDGRNVSPTKYPFVVSLWIDDDFHCGATLISDLCVLTAAHCVPNGITDEHVIYSAEGRNIQAHQRTIERSIIPDDYNVEAVYDKDVAILVLDEKFTHRGVTTVKLDFEPLEEDDIITVLGWGDTEDESAPSRCLRILDLSLIESKRCQSYYSDPITENMFCTDESKGPHTSSGDSGGPALRHGKQVGIVSFGNLTNAYPGGYTRLSSEDVSEFVDDNFAKFCV